MMAYRGTEDETEQQAANEEPKGKRARRVSLWNGEEDARQLAAACRMVVSEVGGSREELGVQVWAPST